LQNNFLNGDVFSNAARIALNETEEQAGFMALFAVNTWDISKNFKADFGLRQNFNSQFGNLNPSVGIRWAANPTVAYVGVGLQCNTILG